MQTINEVARMGGRAVQKKYGRAHYARMGKLSAISKKKNKAKAVDKSKKAKKAR